MAEWTPGAHGVLREGFLNEGKHVSYPAFPTHPPRKDAGIDSFPPSSEPTLGPFRNPCSSLGKGGAVRPWRLQRARARGGECRPGGWAARRAAGVGGRPCRHHLALHSCLGGDASKRDQMRSEGRVLLPVALCFHAWWCAGFQSSVLVSGSLVWDDDTYPHCLQSFLTSDEGCTLCCRLLARLSGVRGLGIVAIIVSLCILPPSQIYSGSETVHFAMSCYWIMLITDFSRKAMASPQRRGQAAPFVTRTLHPNFTWQLG